MSIIRFKFKSEQDFKKAEDVLNAAMKSIGTNHFDYGGTLADKEIRVMDNPKNAEIVEGILKQNNLKFEKEEDSTNWIGPASKLSYSSIIKKLSKEISEADIKQALADAEGRNLFTKDETDADKRKMVKEFITDVNASNTINPVITYTTKSHYGGPELVYVTSEHKEPLNTLTNAKTLSDRHVKALEQLGFKLEKKN